MADGKQVTSNRNRYIARLKERHPDKEYADDEALFGQINEDYDGYDKELSGYKEREKALSDLFASNPRSAAFLIDWRNGEDPIVGLVRKFGDDFKAALEDPEKVEALAAAQKEYAERVTKEREYETQYRQNMDATYATIEQVQQEDGLTDDDIDAAMTFLIGIMKDGILGKFSAESIRMAVKALHHDDDVTQADREGEVRGRNTRIEEQIRRSGRRDGTANLSGKNGGKTTTREMPDLGALERYDGGMNIWERGGERRRPVK